MNMTKLLGVAVAVAMLSTGAMAATMTPAQQCTALQKQFDQEIIKHGSATKAGAAKELRADGAKLCKAGKDTDGVKKLEAALNDIGVKPQS
jgi:predicted lipoprotein